jgi:4-hydroxy-tetrahydrodipicolinate reductase
MITVGISGGGGRMGRLVAEAVAAADDLTLGGLYDPERAGATVAGSTVAGTPESLGGCEVVVEFTRPDVVMQNLRSWRNAGAHAVVGTSGFDAGRIADATALWGDGPPRLLIVPNFSIGAIVMMRLAEVAAPHFAAAEVVEMHHDGKADAPSGTSLAAASRIAEAAEQQRMVESVELVAGARGADASGVPVHAVRLPGLLAHHMILLGGPGETLTIRHDTTDRTSFLPGVLLGVRRVGSLAAPVTVGLEHLLDL